MASLLNLSGSALLNKFTPQRDYSLEYLTIESLADSNTVSIYNKNCNVLPTFYYSTDNGTTWSSITAQKSKTLSVATINTGDKILFKCTQNALATGWDNYNGFNAGKNYKVYGNAMSLIYGDNFVGNNEFRSTSQKNLAALFRENTTLTDAENLILPALTAKQLCYNGMFRGCTNLARGPKLPATTLESDCYGSMFEGCVNLEEAPELPATNLDNVYNPYQRMFQMSRTTSVTAKMTKSPILRAKTLTTNAYKCMFQGNVNLVEVTCLAETWLTGADGSFSDWLKDTSATGTFRKAVGVTLPSGTSGIPSGWTVVDYTE